MVGWKAGGSWILRQVGNPHGRAGVDNCPEQPVSYRQWTNGAPFLWGDSRREERLNRAVLLEERERTVARDTQLPRLLDNLLQDAIQLELPGDCDSSLMERK